MYQNRSLVRENRKAALFSDAEMQEIKEAEPNLPAQVATLMRDLLLAKVRAVNALKNRQEGSNILHGAFMPKRRTDIPMYSLAG